MHAYLITLGLFVFLLAGCRDGSRFTSSKNDVTVIHLARGMKLELPNSQTLRTNLSTEPPSLDWHVSSDTASSQVTENIMDGLVDFDLYSPELKLLPALATEWESSDQARRWKFRLREGVKWSDGVLFTPDQVIDGWRRLLARETASQYAYFLFGIKNARLFNQGRLPWSDVGVKITGANEISIELERSMSYFPSLLAHHATYPARLDVMNKYPSTWTEPEHIVSLGAYKLKAWMHDKILVLERNDEYYGHKPAIRYIACYMINEYSTALNLFDADRLDTVHDLPSIELKSLRKRKEFIQFGRLGLYYYGTNTQKPPMNDVRVRRAVSMAIDRNEIVKMLDGGQIPTTSWVPAGMFGYEPKVGLGFDPEKARKLISEAMKTMKIKNVADFPRIEIKFNTLEDHQRIGENIQAQLKRNLGIRVDLKNEEWKTFLKTLETDPPQLYRFGWQADFPDPDNFLSILTSFAENNRTRWKNKAYDDLVQLGAGLTDPEERRKVYFKAQKILVEDELPVIPLFVSVNHLMVSRRVENYPLSPITRYIFKDVRLRESTESDKN